MKSDKVTAELKERLGITRNDEIIPRLEQALAARPLGATVIVSSAGEISFAPIGLSNPPTPEQIGLIQQALRKTADALDAQKMQLIRADALASVGQEES